MTDRPRPRTLPAWERRFITAGRHGDPAGAESVRIGILHAERPSAGDLALLYTHGSTAERMAVLLALPGLDLPPHEGLPLLHEALRTQHTGLLAAALGPYAAAHLEAQHWRQALLKCLFSGVPVDLVADWPRRARGDGELARMLQDYADERTAAGRPVPPDLTRVLALASRPLQRA